MQFKFVIWYALLWLGLALAKSVSEVEDDSPVDLHFNQKPKSSIISQSQKSTEEEEGEVNEKKPFKKVVLSKSEEEEGEDKKIKTKNNKWENGKAKGEEYFKQVIKNVKNRDGKSVETTTTTVLKGKKAEALATNIFSNLHHRLYSLFQFSRFDPYRVFSTKDYASTTAPSLFTRTVEDEENEEEEQVKEDVDQPTLNVAAPKKESKSSEEEEEQVKEDGDQSTLKVAAKKKQSKSSEEEEEEAKQNKPEKNSKHSEVEEEQSSVKKGNLTGPSKPKLDPCLKVNQPNGVFSYSAVVKCYSSFPFDNNIRDGVLSTIWRTLPFYVFADVARKRSVDSHTKGATKDIESELAILRVKEYESDREFQMDVVNLFMQLRDGHTIYNPACYQNFIFYLPFPLIAVRQQVIKKGGLMDKFEIRIRNQEAPFHPQLIEMWAKSGIDVSLYEGAIVHKIDGQDPVKALQHIADTRYGTSRDPHSRINGALAGYKLSQGKWKLNFGIFAATNIPPEKEFVIFDVTLRNGTVTKAIVPYLAHNKLATQFKSGNDYFATYCRAHPINYPEVIRKMEEEEKKEKEQADKAHPSLGFQFETEMNNYSHLKKSRFLKNKFKKDINFVDLDKPVVDGRDVKFYTFNKDVGVVVLPTFDPSDPILFKKEVITGFKKFKKLGVKKLLLDVSDNGGGIVCYGYAILEYLLPKSTFKPFRLDMHVNPLLTTLLVVDKTEGSSFNVKSIFRPNNTKFNDYRDFLPKDKQRSDVENRYTNFFHNDCRSESFLMDLKKDLGPEETPFNLNEVAVISNSYCYSTCGLFVNTLQELGQVVAYSVGGVPIKTGEKLPTVGSMNGANVMQLDDLILSLNYFNLTSHPLAPQPFPVNATLGFTLMQAYSHFPDKKGLPIPLEFLARTADYHVYWDPRSVADPALVWNQVAAKRGYLVHQDQGNYDGFQVVDRLQAWLNRMFVGSK